MVTYNASNHDCNGNGTYYNNMLNHYYILLVFARGSYLFIEAAHDGGALLVGQPPCYLIYAFM